ncbi:hypothetical protein NMY22_g6857 [Coprinellus aureogranulatus]|nr:hypothetical protein NMY22_g6857 [Coprinellus aureogranulatus]
MSVNASNKAIDGMQNTAECAHRGIGQSRALDKGVKPVGTRKHRIFTEAVGSIWSLLKATDSCVKPANEPDRRRAEELQSVEPSVEKDEEGERETGNCYQKAALFPGSHISKQMYIMSRAYADYVPNSARTEFSSHSLSLVDRSVSSQSSISLLPPSSQPHDCLLFPRSTRLGLRRFNCTRTASTRTISSHVGFGEFQTCTPTPAPPKERHDKRQRGMKVIGQQFTRAPTPFPEDTVDHREMCCLPYSYATNPHRTLRPTGPTQRVKNRHRELNMRRALLK